MPNRRTTPFSVFLIVPLLAVVSVLGLATSAAANPATAPGVWMLRDPGCGGQHLARHPKDFGLTCDPIAWVEKVHWLTWGGAKARAKGTINIADLKHGGSVAQAPRLRFKASIVASDTIRCGRHQVYKSVKIHFRENGKRRVASLPPPFLCPELAEGAGLEEFMSPDRHVLCFIGEGAADCISYLSKSPEITHSAVLHPGGKVSVSSCSAPSPETSVCLQHWFNPPVLGYGQWTGIAGVRCRSSQAGITCIEVSGVGKGHGFRVSKGEAVEVEA